MKCIQSLGRAEVIRRVDDELAAAYVNAGKYKYCPKELWKKEVRDAKKEDHSSPKVIAAVTKSERKGIKPDKSSHSLKGKARKTGKKNPPKYNNQ